MAKRFFYVCAAFLCLVLSYHFGAANAQGRTGTNPAVSVAFQGGATFLAMTAAGDAYESDDVGTTWRFKGNIFGATTPTGP